MKKILILSSIFLSSLSFAQGSLNIFNYSSYDLAMRVEAGNTTNCLPSVITSMNFPASHSDVIDNFNDSLPYTAGWSVRLSTTGSPTNVTVPSGLLTTVSSLTRWQFCWYQTMDPVTGNTVYDTVDFNMGDTSAFPNCGWSSSTNITGTLTKAFWFYIPSSNATYLVIDPA